MGSALPTRKLRGMILDELHAVVAQRRTADPADSYTARLLNNPELVQRKIMEEAFEVCLELGRADIDAERVTSEAADLLYHLLVGVEGVGVDFGQVLAELEVRNR